MAVAVSSVKLVDVEEEAQIFLTFDSGPPKTINVPPMADGASSTVAIGEKDVVAMRIRLKGLDAVDDLKFFECNTFGGGGEPHIKPWTGHRYYFMGECDTVLLASQDFDAYIRTTIKDFFSFIEAAALRLGNSVIEMSIGETDTFYVNGQEFTTADLPLEIEGKFGLEEGAKIEHGIGTNYVLTMGSFIVELRVMKFIMAVEFTGYLPSFTQGTGGLTGAFPKVEVLGRDGTTLFTHDSISQTINGKEEPVCNAIGQEWQVRDVDPQLFREIREPAWPKQCTFPEESATATQRRLTSATISLEAASKACAEVHPVDSTDFEFCVMDVMMLDNLDAAYSW